MKRLKLDIQLFAEEDGWVTIGAKLDSKQLEKDLKNEKSKLEKFEKEAEKLNEQKIKIDAEVELKGKEFDRKVKEIQDKAKIDIQAISGGSYASRKAKEQKIEETAQLKINQLTQQYEQYLEQADNKIENIDKKLQENAYNQGLVNNNIDEMGAKLKQVRGFEEIKGSVENVGNSLQKVTKRIAKMAVAVFGIRSAFMFVRNAINTIANDDEQLKADIDYMKSAIAYTLEPLVRGIVNLVKQLMFYVGYIVKAWTGKNIFANANKSLASANKQAKELQKTTASFDEMNVLNDNSSNSGGVSPSFDLSAPDNIEPPKWLTWIVEHKPEILATLYGIAGGLIAIKSSLTLLQALGVGIALAGIAYTMQKIIDFMNDPTFNNFIGILEGIAIAVLGIAIAVEAWPVAIGAAVALIVLLIVQNFDKIKKHFENLIKWLDKNVLGALRKLFGPLGDILYIPIKYFVELAKGAFESFFGGIKKVINGVMKIFKGDFKGGIKDIFGGLLSIMTAPLQGFIKAVGKVWGHIKESVNYWKDKFKEIFGKIGDFFMKPINGFINAIKGLWDKIKDSVGDVGRKIGDALNPINIVDNVKKGLGNIGNNVKKFFGFAKGGVIYPKLAVGGIINQPGRGVPLGSAIGGERGAEGVIPLTDSQQMALLGEAIGKYITINANIVNTMNGRVISRELQKVQNESNFAFNR